MERFDIEHLDELFQLMQKRNIQSFKSESLEVTAFYPDRDRAKLVEKSEVPPDDPQDKPVVKVPEMKIYSDDDILMNPYVGMTND